MLIVTKLLCSLLMFSFYEQRWTAVPSCKLVSPGIQYCLFANYALAMCHSPSDSDIVVGLVTIYL